MITSFSLKNFKAFKQLDDFSIGNLTVICGKNSCGKSSIMQSLLLLKQTLLGELEKQAMLLDGPYLQYSNLKEIAFGLPVEQSASIEYDIKITSGDIIGNLNFEIRHKQIPGEKDHKGPVVNKFKWGTVNGKSHIIQLRKGMYQCPNTLDKNDLPNSFSPVGKREIQFDHFLPKYIVQAARKVNGKNERDVFKLAYPIELAVSNLEKLLSSFRNEINRLKYLGPSRAFPRRAYVHYSDKHYDLDEDGSNAAHIYWLKRKDKVWWKGRKIELQAAVTKCLEIMGLNQKIYPKQSSNIIYQLEVETIANSNKRVTIADVGFGYSQLLPIILRGLLAERGSLILFEQPEIHLHPSCQARLADLFLAFNESKKRIMVETHSADLINRLRYLAIENTNLVSTISIVFVEPPSSDSGIGSTIRRLNLTEDGMFDEWPEGFCDESEKLARDILHARIRRSEKNV